LHANASRIEVELDGADDAHVVLRVRDDGTGFDPAVRDDERYGLRGMEERARLIRGTLRVDSSTTEGTLVEAVVPKPPA
jgi:two-component system sensor histidine kinase DegS